MERDDFGTSDSFFACVKEQLLSTSSVADAKVRASRCSRVAALLPKAQNRGLLELILGGKLCCEQVVFKSQPADIFPYKDNFRKLLW